VVWGSNVFTGVILVYLTYVRRGFLYFLVNVYQVSKHGMKCICYKNLIIRNMLNFWTGYTCTTWFWTVYAFHKWLRGKLPQIRLYDVTIPNQVISYNQCCSRRISQSDCSIHIKLNYLSITMIFYTTNNDRCQHVTFIPPPKVKYFFSYIYTCRWNGI
jgi:hypothetical protein